jgi:hypothetical protein
MWVAHDGRCDLGGSITANLDDLSRDW